MEAGLAGSKMTATRSGFPRYFKLDCSHPMSIFGSYGVADARYVAMISNFDGICVSDSLRLGLSACYRGLNHHDVDMVVLILDI